MFGELSWSESCRVELSSFSVRVRGSRLSVIRTKEVI
jgi:hypothetical protein